ncbi:hypothetical protein [Paludibaculum fermentans]|uniref:hypothetical protein n=1 Tax=Paludibaculum fermentans TaxID=1473598 RepID=UPI003EC08443
MRNDVTTNDARAAAALARGIQQTDANLDLHSAAAAAVAAYEDPARFQELCQAISDGFQPRSLHEQVVAASVASSLWSQKRYARFECGLLNARLLEGWDQAAPGTPEAAPARRLLQAVRSLSRREQATLQTLLGLQHRLHFTSRANADRLTRANQARQAAAGLSPRKDR